MPPTLEALRRAVVLDPGGPAQQGMARLVAAFVGSGLLFYLAVLWGAAKDQARWSAWWFTPLAVGVSVVGAAVLLAGAVTARTGMIRGGAWIVVVGIPAYHLLWTPAWSGHEFPDLSQYPWALDFVGLAPMAGVLLLRGRVLVVYHLVLCVGVQLVPAPFRPTLGVEDVALWTVNSVVFSGVFVLGTYSLYRSGARADLEAAHAEELAAETAGTAAMAVERERLDALIHDDVLGTLLAVTRTGTTATVAESARRATARLEAAGRGRNDEELSVTAFVGLLRGAIGTVDPSIGLTVDGDVEGDSEGVTAVSSVAGDLAAATMEAVRNSVLHSGDPAGPRVLLTLVEGRTRVADRRRGADRRVGLRIRVVDHGRGFDPSAIPQLRLGIRGSILRRVNALDGGSATVSSRPGRGTTVRIEWTP